MRCHGASAITVDDHTVKVVVRADVVRWREGIPKGDLLPPEHRGRVSDSAPVARHTGLRDGNEAGAGIRSEIVRQLIQFGSRFSKRGS